MTDRAPVFLVTGRDPRHYSGCAHSAYVRAHAWAAQRAGFDTHIFCLSAQPGQSGSPYGQIHAAHTPHHYVRQSGIHSHSTPLQREVLSAAAHLKASSLVLHGFGVWSFVAVRAAHALRQRGVAATTLTSSYTTHLDETLSLWRGALRHPNARSLLRFGSDLAWSFSVVSWYERIGYRHADLVWTNYETVRNLVVRRHGRDVAIELAPYSIEQDFAPQRKADAQRQTPGRTPLIVCVARHDPRKGVDVLISALARLKNDGVRFRAKLIGGGLLLDRHRELATRLRCDAEIEILGYVDDVEPLLRQADMFALPSLEEQSGSLALLEAMRLGLACVSSGCDGICEDIENGVDGLLAAPGDAEGLATQLRRVLEDPSLRQRLGAAARATFVRRFSAERLTAALAQTYKRMLSGGHS